MNGFASGSGRAGMARQRGAALVVVLMLLIIVTILGIASMRGAIMQERMAANFTGRGYAFQAAEAGLRQAELIARDQSITFPTSGCAAGRCKEPAWTAAGFWKDGNTGYQSGTPVPVGAEDAPINITPKFVIEDYGTTSVSGSGVSGCADLTKPCFTGDSQKVYRITSYAAAPNGAEVILQSIYYR